jgi:hypothetical protein
MGVVSEKEISCEEENDRLSGLSWDALQETYGGLRERMGITVKLSVANTC